MKIGISSTGRELNSLLDTRFGRCIYLIIYDTVNNSVKVIENQGQASGGGAGIAAAQQMIDEDVDAVITGNAGPNAYNLLKNSGIRVYRCGSIKVELAIQLFKEGKLEEIVEAGPSHGGMRMGHGGYKGGWN